MQSIAVIGAGMAGITLARALSEKARVTVFEKSRGPGGRMSARRMDDYRLDHGAQFFTVRSAGFQRLVEELVAAGIVGEWQGKVVTLDSQRQSFKREWFEPHYVGIPAMNTPLRSLAKNLTVHYQHTITALQQKDSKWTLKDAEANSHGCFDWVVCTPPAPQVLTLLPEIFEPFQAVQDVVYSPCFALWLTTPSPVDLNFSAAVVRNSPIAWIAEQGRKQGTTPTRSLLVHSDNEWARSHLEGDLEGVGKEMLLALGNFIELPEPEKCQVELHRWRFARVESTAEQDFILDAEQKLAACGDWCLGSRVEDAFLSANKLAERLQTLI